MKEYRVSYYVFDAEQIAGTKGCRVNQERPTEITEANSPEEAIENIIYYLQEQITLNNCGRLNAEIKDGTIVVTNNETDEVVDEYAEFTAEEVE